MSNVIRENEISSAAFPISSKPLLFFGLAASLAITYAAAALGGLASATSGDFYRELVRPSWAPPGSVFGPVWGVLYLMMAVAAWLVWRQQGFNASRKELGLYLLQLVFNALWTWIFFVWQFGFWSFVEIILLWFLILGTVISFWKIRPLAGALLLPYLGWVSFAAALTFSLWQKNPGLLG